MASGNTYRGFKVRDRWVGPEAPGIKLLKDRDGWYQRSLENAGERATAPFKGITANGSVEPGLFALHKVGDDMGPARVRALEFLSSLNEDQRRAAMRPIDDPDWGRWSNAVEAPHGASFLTMTGDQRSAAFAIMQATLSQSGFETTRSIMKLNESLGELVGNTELLGEWNYSFHIFGTPSAEEPWGWQIHGHHLIVSCLAIGNQIVLTPTFMGAEPRVAESGKYAGLSVLQEEETAALQLINGLSQAQQEKAILFRSILRADLPPDRTHPTEGRHKAGALQDNLVLPYEGLPGEALSPGQVDLLLRLIKVYVGRMSLGHARLRMDEIKRHIERTFVVWMGGCEANSIFYYRLHSPVLLIEFDHHHGVFLDNDEPEPFHTHTIMRTPNGNDYGKDLLRQHYELAHRRLPGAAMTGEDVSLSGRNSEREAR